MNRKKVSMNDIAEKLDISVVSVSKAINYQSGISEELRRRILDTAFEMGYSAPKKRSGGDMLKFAYFIPQKYAFESELFYTQLFYYLNEICAQNNIVLSLFVIGAEDEKKTAVPPLMNSIRFDGIFIGGEVTAEYVNTLRQFGIPVVCIDFYTSGIDIDSVVVDNFYASFRATDCLIQNGHVKIGFLSHPDRTSSITDRFFGFQRALYQHGLHYNRDWLLNVSDSMALPDDMPTAFVCHNDTSALLFARILMKSGLNVPDDISLVSFDNLEIGAGGDISLTTVDLNRRTFAEKAFELMTARLQNQALPVQRLYVDTSIVTRASVKNLRI
ncbi:MAG: LacI family DNA-binding transcriptional regulator [Defluviitaleaceae bacterium]|nr:LacI family DNA-binding transcriptional regulator [Defluviitaleaceae bacterium]